MEAHDSTQRCGFVKSDSVSKSVQARRRRALTSLWRLHMSSKKDELNAGCGSCAGLGATSDALERRLNAKERGVSKSKRQKSHSLVKSKQGHAVCIASKSCQLGRRAKFSIT
jgi:hypothetical protein